MFLTLDGKPITASQTMQKLQHNDNKPPRLFHTTRLEINNLWTQPLSTEMQSVLLRKECIKSVAFPCYKNTVIKLTDKTENYPPQKKRKKEKKRLPTSLHPTDAGGYPSCSLFSLTGSPGTVCAVHATTSDWHPLTQSQVVKHSTFSQLWAESRSTQTGLLKCTHINT